jgi:hypothetical protein
LQQRLHGKAQGFVFSKRRHSLGVSTGLDRNAIGLSSTR